MLLELPLQLPPFWFRPRFSPCASGRCPASAQASTPDSIVAFVGLREAVDTCCLTLSLSHNLCRLALSYGFGLSFMRSPIPHR